MSEEEIKYEQAKKIALIKIVGGLFLLNELLVLLGRIPYGTATTEDWAKFDQASQAFAAAGNVFVTQVGEIFTKNKPKDPTEQKSDATN